MRASRHNMKLQHNLHTMKGNMCTETCIRPGGAVQAHRQKLSIQSTATQTLSYMHQQVNFTKLQCSEVKPEFNDNIFLETENSNQTIFRHITTQNRKATIYYDVVAEIYSYNFNVMPKTDVYTHRYSTSLDQGSNVISDVYNNCSNVDMHDICSLQ